jgi:hypothetical protein
MKFIFIFIFSLLFIDIACICKPKCDPGQKLECPKRTRPIPIGYCQLMRQCKCVKKDAYDELKMKDIIKRLISNNNKTKLYDISKK